MTTDAASRASAGQAELSGAKLRDPRRSARLEQIAYKAGLHVGASLPKQAGGVAELEATYRFLNSEHVTPAGILQPHILATRGRCAVEQLICVVHDTTEFDFGKRAQLGDLNGGLRKGFFSHVSLAVSGDGTRRPLGVLSIETLFRDTVVAKGKRPTGRESEAGRWHRGIDASIAALGGQRAVHVADREGDSESLLRHLLDAKQDFVVRANFRRAVVGGRLTDVVAAMPCVTEREVELSDRAPNPSPKHRRIHPPRHARRARLQINAGRVEFKAGGMALNVVLVREVDTPEGQPAVEWLLWTTLPVSSPEEFLRIVDIYCARWVIEEYFRALKSGCLYESLQLESRHALLNALAVYAPIAWLLLHLRSTARTAGAEPAAHVLTPTHLLILRHLYRETEKRDLPEALSAREAMLAIARIGGHLKQNGDPGWITLGRGLHDVLMAEVGFRIARGEM